VKVLVYDGDCPLCNAASAAFVRLRLVRGEDRRPFQEFQGEVRERLLDAGIHNEMAVLDPESGGIRSGFPGFLWLLRETWLAPLARLLDRPLFRGVGDRVYHMVSYNRRILTPPKSGITCACDPDPSPGYQVALIVLLLAFALVMTALFGAAVARGTGLTTPALGAFQMVVAAGSGWVLLFLAALTLPSEVRLPFLGHLGMVMAAGLLVLVPSMLLSLAPPGPWLAVLFGVSVAVSFTLMLRMLGRRLRYLGLSRAWLAGWTAALWAGATASVWFFYFR
jgi:predicted DCC family thiol-disulfide oxidoreductase YuxK